MSELIRYSSIFAAMVIVQSQSQLSQYRKGGKILDYVEKTLKEGMLIPLRANSVILLGFTTPGHQTFF